MSSYVFFDSQKKTMVTFYGNFYKERRVTIVSMKSLSMKSFMKRFNKKLPGRVYGTYRCDNKKCETERQTI